jgi:NAD(P)-dependent dehydrogenase (short-subunit alcohol dehydrogenase family)
MRLAGKVAAITGAARNGLGRAIALAFAREGAAVGVLDIRSSDETVAAVGGLARRAFGVQADVADPDATAAALAGIAAALGPIDVLVNAAAVLARGPVLELLLDDWDRLYQVNLRGYFVTSRWVAKEMVRRGAGGSIINIASISGVVATPNQAHYCALKGGVIALTRCMAVELAPLGIRVNAISPGAFETDINRERLQDPVFRASRTDPVPLARVGRPEEVAGAAVLLASEEGSFMVGANVIVDGGQLAL